MSAYYNEHDPHAAQWLRNLIDAGHIAPGIVDDRDIRDISPDDLTAFTQCHFFAGIGVWSHALRSAGWADDRPVWSGSCPCQPFSAAGERGGFDDERHLWPAWFHLIEQCRPPAIFGEQVASKDGLGWLDLVSADLEGTGYAFGAADLCAAGAGVEWDGREIGTAMEARMCSPVGWSEPHTPIRVTASGRMLTGSSAAMESGGRLDPAHSRWLMTLPPAWDDCAPTAMRSTRKPPSRG